MAIKISSSTIIDDSRNIVNAGVATANYFDGFFPAGDKVYDQSTTVNNNKVNVALESDIIVGSGKTLTISTGSTIILNPFDFETSSVDELLIDKSLHIGFTSSFNSVTSGVGSVGVTSTRLVGFGTVVPPNIEAGLLVKPIPGVIAVGTTVVSFVSAGSSTGVSTITINPASLNNVGILTQTFKFGSYGEKESNLILDGEKGNITLKDDYGTILNSIGNPILNQTGSVLQVVQQTTNTAVTITSITFSDTNLTASITPTSATSKVLVLVDQNYVVSSASQSSYGGIRLVRGSTTILAPVGGGSDSNPYEVGLFAGGATSTSLYGRYHMIYLDSPGTTNSTTYKTQGAVNTAGHSLGCQISDVSKGTSTITLIEIAS